MDVHRPRRSLRAGLAFSVRRNPVGTRLARAAATKTVAGSAQPPVMSQLRTSRFVPLPEMSQKCVDIAWSVTLGMQLVKTSSSRTDVTLFGVRVSCMLMYCSTCFEWIHIP